MFLNVGSLLTSIDHQLDTLQQTLIAHSLWHYLIEIRAKNDPAAAAVANWYEAVKLSFD